MFTVTAIVEPLTDENAYRRRNGLEPFTVRLVGQGTTHLAAFTQLAVLAAEQFGYTYVRSNEYEPNWGYVKYDIREDEPCWCGCGSTQPHQEACED